MNGRIVDPEKYGMEVCPCCGALGYVLSPDRRCCPKCGGFGFVKKEAKRDANLANASSEHH